ncbi:MAG: PadR family transcriptional regulator [Thermoanaerobaculia bacterium]
MSRILLREIVLGLWKIHILHHAAEGTVVGNHLLQELREHGYDPSPGTLYPLLHRMERYGWLASETKEAGGIRAQRTYRITDQGLEVLDQCAHYVSELDGEIRGRVSRPSKRD